MISNSYPHLLSHGYINKMEVKNRIMVTADTGRALINAQRAEAVSFGRAFIANPDLVARIRSGAQLAKPDYTKLYVGEEQGYTDYPALNIAVE